jgi:hypothetical protein
MKASRRSWGDRRRRLAGLGSVLFSVSIASAAVASGPPVLDAPTGFGFCKGGPNAGQPCQFHTDCEPGVAEEDLKDRCRVTDFLKGPGTSLKGELTVVVDDDLHDLCPLGSDLLVGTHCPGQVPAVLPRKAAAMILEVKHKGQTHVFADVYQDVDPEDPPSVTVTETAPVLEQDMGSPGSMSLEDRCEEWVPKYRQPNPAMAQAILDLAGLSEGWPVIVSSKHIGPTLEAQNVSNHMASVMRCKVRIRIIDAPLLYPPGP